MGGSDSFVSKLDSMFTCRRYWHGNEPCHQVAYMFNYAGRYDLTQKWVRYIAATEYQNTPGGLSGNDDAGQMSAWFAFSAMGFYPVCSSIPEYALGAPLFERVTISPDGGREFVIEAVPTLSCGSTARVLGRPFVSHDDILDGGTLYLPGL